MSIPSSDPLFDPLQIGDVSVPHRVLMAPLTRSRSTQPGDVPNEMMATYYAQRAGAGLIISEATQVSPQGKGYAFTPGIHSDEQVEGWRLVTDRVHNEGGKIFLQLWHVGRISHVDLQPDGGAPVAPSPIGAESQTYISADSGMVDVSPPRALSADEIPGVIDQFRQGAERAKQAGFDGVEVHGANGYLLDQFTRDGTNLRDDDWGGSTSGRLRFPLEVTRAVVEVWGAGRVGYRVSPLGPFNSMEDSDPIATFGLLASRLGEMGLAYLHVVEAFVQARDEQTEQMSAALKESFSNAGGGVYIGNGDYTQDLARTRIRDGRADAVTFGKAFIANPDLPERFRLGAPLNEPDAATFYGGTEKGYTDYPFLDAAAKEASRAG